MKKEKFNRFIGITLLAMSASILFVAIMVLIGAYSSVSDTITMDDMIIGWLTELFSLTVEPNREMILALLLFLILLAFGCVFFVGGVIAIISAIKESFEDFKRPVPLLDPLDDGEGDEHLNLHFDANYDEPTENYQPIKLEKAEADENEE